MSTGNTVHIGTGPNVTGPAPTVPPTPAPAAAPAVPPPPPAPAAAPRARRQPAAAAAPAAAPQAARSGSRWAWTQQAAQHVPVALSGLLMVAVVASTWKTGDDAGTTNWVRDVMGWAWRHAQPLAVGLFLLSVAYAYTPWRSVYGTFRQHTAGTWTWRVIGLYAAGLAAGTATLLACLAIGGDSRWAVWVGVLDMVAVMTLFALAAHWNPQWEAPPVMLGVWAGGFMLLVPGWIALCNLAAKI